MTRANAAAAAAFLILATAMTWPLGRNLDRAVAYAGDPYVNTWVLDWDYYATFHAPLRLFHANAFHPARYALAFTENLYGVALFLFPFRILGAEPLTAYNIGMILGFALSGFGAYLLGVRLTGSAVAGFTAGLFYAFVPFRFMHVTHIQHVWGVWIPVLLLALIAYVDRPSWKTAGLFGGAFVMNGLTNVHWFLFGTFAVGVTAGLFFASGIRRWKELGIASAAAIAVLAPFYYPYFAVASVYKMARTWEEAAAYSAVWSDWWVAGDYTRWYGVLRDSSVDPERWLFPGVIALICSALAVPNMKRNPRAVVIGLVWVLIGVWGSVGVNGFLHQLLFDAAPGFKAVRAPARWAAIAYAGMAVLVAITTARWRRFGVVVPLLLLVELWPTPIRWWQSDPEPPAVYRWLATLPENDVVLELPIDVLGSDYLYLLRSTAHHRKLINPPRLINLAEPYKSTPIPDSFLSEVQRAGGKWIVVHADILDRYGDDTRAWLRRELARGRLHFVRRFESELAGDWVFTTVRGSPTSPRDPQLERFLAGLTTYNSDTFGSLDPVPPVIRGGVQLAGYAFSPHGIRKVDLLFEQGSVRIPTAFLPDSNVSALYPWYPQTPRPRFVARLTERPPGVRVETDVQFEITDGRGRVKLMGERWFRWE
jgi:hypothetical protein